MNAWYILKTKPRTEDRVASLLNHVPLTTFLPKVKKLNIRFESFVPLFPSYLFIRTDFSDPHVHRLVRFTRGVVRILGDELGPIPISDEIVESLISRTRDGALIEQDLLFKEGDEVRVRAGILKDLIGIIEKNMSETGRVHILFKWLSGNMQATLGYRLLEKVA